MNTIKTLYLGGTAEVVEKKSRFIATLKPVSSEAEAVAFIEETKKKYWDARHNCAAFTIGENNETTRCSDDGEPSGTAGKPMLDVLLYNKVHNAAVVVTRYFGGVLLGTGGLVRAYQAAVREGLNNSTVLEKKEGILYHIQTDYNGIGKIQYILGKENINILSTEYTENVSVEIMLPADIKTSVINQITEATNGKTVLLPGKEGFFGIINGELVE